MIFIVLELLGHGISISFYMFHGGTSFGFMNRALGNLQTADEQLWFSSFNIDDHCDNVYKDNDAPLTESGDYTTKYHLLRSLLSAFNRKCSHGDPGIGINKDAIDSSHGLDHHKAADVATTASVQLLEKIWKNNDDPSFFK
ncbi:beta-galactosidase-1 2 [Labeo rohita]|uniref:Beta-galactosidase-1 2 n=1 Tax=Labeo rohita TaxID=84645 RepID=A0A498MEB8_LABRO|nr:beta-galactosidase-1 2 [Labeo rohita]